MILHYLKVAFRNLLKYRTQNLISTIGLAVGLLYFSICFYCSRYMHSIDQCFDTKDSTSQPCRSNQERIKNYNLKIEQL